MFFSGLQETRRSSATSHGPMSNRKPVTESAPVVQVTCGDHFNVVLTSNNKLYSWGLANEGRLGVEKLVAKNQIDHSFFTAQPQNIKLPSDVRIDRIESIDMFTYAEATICSGDVEGALGVEQRTTYAWGTMPIGLDMRRKPSCFKKPTELELYAPYNFSKIKMSNNVAFGVSHGVSITFAVPNEEKPEQPPAETTVLAIPVLEPISTKNTDDLHDALTELTELEVMVVNDFDVPWVTEKKMKMARVHKKKVRKIPLTVGGARLETHDDEEGEDDEEDEEDFEEKDNEEEDNYDEY